MIITIGREYGSGGHVIASKLADYFQIPLYDRNLLVEIANEKNLTNNSLLKYDEIPKHILFSRTVKGYSNSPEEIVANMQFDYLLKKADEKQSYVVVGRCAEQVLKDYNEVLSIFIMGDHKDKLTRIQQVRNMDQEDAEKALTRHDKKRKMYHNYYCDTKWGDSRGYDLSINSSRLGIDGTAQYLASYIEAWKKSSLQ